MKKLKYIVPLLICFLFSCATTELPYHSLTSDNVKEALDNFPKQEDHLNAAAITLLSYSSIEMLNDGTMIYKNILRYKIFNERGYSLATQSIRYRDGYEKVKILFANTIRPDGTVVPLEKKDIKDVAPYSEYEFYTDIKQKNFTMPAIEPNCIVEYAFEVKNMKPTLPYDLYVRFFFRDKIPLKEDILEIILPKDHALNIAYFKTDIKPDVEEAGGKIKYTFKNLNQPEIIPEPEMPDMYDKEVFPQFHCWTLSNWDIISKWYSGLIKEQMQSDAELENFTKTLIADKTTDEDKIRAIFYFVAQKIRYVAVELGPHTHKPHLPSDVFKNRYGDCKDKTTLLLTMLKIAGIEGVPVLVPQTPDELDESAPNINVFNHVIAAVPTKNDTFYWLDATNEIAAFNSVPFFEPQKVLVINMDGSYKFIKTPEMDDNRDYHDYNQVNRVNEDGDADVEYTYTYHGKTAESERYALKYKSPDERKKDLGEGNGIELTNLEILNLDDLESPLIIKIKGLKRNVVQKLDETTMVLSNITRIVTYNEATAAKSRKYPISFMATDLFKIKEIYYFPEGYKIKKLPPEYNIEDPYRKCNFKCESMNNIFSVENHFKYFKYTMNADLFEAFKKHDLAIQKFKANVKNIIFEKE